MKKIIKNRLSTIGYLPMLTKTSRGPGNLNANFAGSNMAEVALELAPSETRTISTDQVVKKWREFMPDLPVVKELSPNQIYFLQEIQLTFNYLVNIWMI